MSTSEELTDAYVAALLSKDAENVRRGVGLSSSRPRNAPKPSTRFLKSIIKETTSHNTALLEREKRIQQDHLRRHPTGDPTTKQNFSSRRREDHSRDQPTSHSRASETTTRPLAEEGHSRIRRKEDLTHHRTSRYPTTDPTAPEERPSKRRKEERPGRWSSSLIQSGLLGERTTPRKKRKSQAYDTRAGERQRRHASQHSPRRRKDETDHRAAQESNPRDEPAKVVNKSAQHTREYEAARDRTAEHHQRDEKPAGHDIEDDSDPLEALLGPLPPDRIRGRGRTEDASGINARFADPSYNPRVEQDSESDKDDWDEALSDFRQRSKRRSIDPQRLLAAGFDETVVQRYNRPPNVKPDADDVENVVWKKQGEAREWDRGKIMAEDGVTTGPQWATGLS